MKPVLASIYIASCAVLIIILSLLSNLNFYEVYLVSISGAALLASLFAEYKLMLELADKPPAKPRSAHSKRLY